MVLQFIRLKNVSIEEQLALEESLLRKETGNFCLCNEGSSPAIVMGISGKQHEWVHTENAQALGLPILRRFSGGGTVVVDENTLFVSLICNKSLLPYAAYPEKILRWSESFYQKSLEIPDFALRDNDFVIGDKKCGGNAQYITKDRFLQHTSFLWDFCPNKMAALLHPPKTPPYRKNREHREFLCSLKEHLPSKDRFFHGIQTMAETISINEKLS